MTSTQCVDTVANHVSNAPTPIVGVSKQPQNRVSPIAPLSIGGTVSRATLCFLALLIVGFPETGVAQDQSLASILPRAFAQVVTMNPSSDGNKPLHETHFFAALGEQGQAAFALNKLMVLQLATFPVPTSSGAFVFNFDPGTRLFTPASKSFGSGYAERALTNGQGRFEFGLTEQHVRFSSFEGFSLNGGNNMVYGLQHNDCCGTPAGASPDSPRLKRMPSRSAPRSTSPRTRLRPM